MNLTELVDQAAANTIAEQQARQQATAAQKRQAELDELIEQANFMVLENFLHEGLGPDLVADLMTELEGEYTVSDYKYPCFSFKFCGQEFGIVDTGNALYSFAYEDKGNPQRTLVSALNLKEAVIGRLAAAKIAHDEWQATLALTEELRQEIEAAKARQPRYKVTPFRLYRWTFWAGSEEVTGYTTTRMPSDDEFTPLIVKGEIRHFCLPHRSNLAIEAFDITDLADLPPAMIKVCRVHVAGIGCYHVKDRELLYRKEDATYTADAGIQPLPVLLDLVGDRIQVEAA